MVITQRGVINAAVSLKARELLEMLLTVDARRRPERFQDLLTLCEIIHGDGPESASYAPRGLLLRAAAELQQVDEQSISQRPDFHPDMIFAARLAKIETLLDKEKI